MKKTIITFIILIVCAAASAQQTAPSMASMMEKATAEAKRSHRNVLLLFRASWCGWCHTMDMSMRDIRVKKYFDSAYVVKLVTVFETKDNKSLEIAGAVDTLNRYNNDSIGLPVWMIFDADGKFLADSKKEGKENTGCPSSETEIAFFIDVLRKTSSLGENALAAIASRFRENKH
jgi:thioredoxin-related protein